MSVECAAFFFYFSISPLMVDVCLLTFVDRNHFGGKSFFFVRQVCDDDNKFDVSRVRDV